MDQGLPIDAVTPLGARVHHGRNGTRARVEELTETGVPLRFLHP
jgi:hypothetical protein